MLLMGKSTISMAIFNSYVSLLWFSYGFPMDPMVIFGYPDFWVMFSYVRRIFRCDQRKAGRHRQKKKNR